MSWLTALFLLCIAALALDVLCWVLMSRALASGSSGELEGSDRDDS